MEPTGIIFAGLDCDADSIEAWNRWYDLEHVPPNVSMTGVMLGLARVMGETAPLLILVSYAVGINFSPTSDTMGALPTMINAGRDQPPQMPGYERVWAAALTLIIIVMLLNLLARGIARASKLKEK